MNKREPSKAVKILAIVLALLMLSGAAGTIITLLLL